MAYGRYAIHKGDAFGWLARRRPCSVHAVVTDPPFGLLEYSRAEVRRLRNGAGVWRLPPAFDGANRRALPRFTVLDVRHHKTIADFQKELAGLLLRVLVPGAHVFVASNTLLSHLVATSFTDKGFELRGQIARVVRTFRGGDRPKFGHEEFDDLSVIPRSTWEPWLLFRKPFEGRVFDNLLCWGTGALRRPTPLIPFFDLIASGTAPQAERNLADHPSLKPQAFLRRLIHAALPLGRGTLVDPFMGSGSTLAAASALGRYSIGIERDNRFFAMARRAIPLLRQIEVPCANSGEANHEVDAGKGHFAQDALTHRSTFKRAEENRPIQLSARRSRR